MSTYLKKSIAVVVAAMSLGLASDAFAGNNSSTNELETIHIVGWDNPFDVANDAFDWTIDDYNVWDVGVSYNDDSGGGGDDDSSPQTNASCAQLRAAKPQNCPNPIPFPAGYGYGDGQYASASGIPKVLYWINHLGGVSPSARQVAINGLSCHTSAITNSFISLERAN